MRLQALSRVVKTVLLATAAYSFGTAAAATPPPAQSCADCHGADGASTESDIPVIGGQSTAYLQDAMEDYRSGARPCPESKYRAGDKKRAPTDMCKLAKALSDQDLKLVADYFSQRPFVRAKQTFDATKAAVGKKVHSLHCEKCHADGGSSKDDDSGILAGQWMPYLEHSFKEFADGTRKAPKKMKPKFDELTPAEKDALLHFYGSAK